MKFGIVSALRRLYSYWIVFAALYLRHEYCNIKVSKPFENFFRFEVDGNCYA